LIRGEREDEEETPHDPPKEDTFDLAFKKLRRLISMEAAKAFFDEAVGHDIDNKRLTSIMEPFIEKALNKAFKGRQGIKTFLINVGYLNED
jgi:hypothetical protein